MPLVFGALALWAWLSERSGAGILVFLLWASRLPPFYT
jgi:hypothetical protein